MSALGQQRPICERRAMSALPPLAINRYVALNNAPGHKRWVFVGVPLVYFSAESGLAICPKSS